MQLLLQDREILILAQYTFQLVETLLPRLIARQARMITLFLHPLAKRMQILRSGLFQRAPQCFSAAPAGSCEPCFPVIRNGPILQPSDRRAQRHSGFAQQHRQVGRALRFVKAFFQPVSNVLEFRRALPG
jgi:hypothetical protein